MAYQILWIDDDQDLVTTLQYPLQRLGYEISTCRTLQEGSGILHQRVISLVLLDLDLGNDRGQEGLHQFQEENPGINIVVVSGERQSALIEAGRYGAIYYLPKPFSIDSLHRVIQKMQGVKSIRERHDALIAQLNPPSLARQFIGVSPGFQTLLRQAGRLKGHLANVLLQGASGTGKELLARYIHTNEGNFKRPFIAVNCAAIPEGLVESELFGHERGAFTGATQRQLGKFELADGGDIFLDEICALRLDLQAKILRVLQEQEIVRVGGSHPVKVEFRVIAASNQSLEIMVEKGVFRRDLFHRLCVVQINIPPLSKRREDIPLLIAHFLEKHCQGEQPKRLTSDALRRLQQYEWPGNVRELENVIQSLVILTPGDVIDTPALPSWTNPSAVAAKDFHEAFPTINWSEPTTLPGLRIFIRAAEKTYIQRVLEMHAGDKSAAALALHVGRTTLYSKLKELGLMT